MCHPRVAAFAAGPLISWVCACTCVSEAQAADNHTIAIEAPADARVGQAVRAVLRITPKGKYKMNLRYPTALTLAAPAGVDLPKTKLRGEDVTISEQEARIEVAFTPRDAGQKVFAGELKFSVCTAQACDIKKEKVSWTTTAK
jgi:hypothetical protein